MKQIISLLLVAALLAFLCMTNPTTEEFAAWYTAQAGEALDAEGDIVDQLLSNLSTQLATRAERDSYMICSVFTYKEHKTLGIGLMFFSIDSLSEQVEELRDAYADWLDSNID